MRITRRSARFWQPLGSLTRLPISNVLLLPERCTTGTPMPPRLTDEPPAHLQLEESASFDRHIIHYIQRAAATGLYEIRGLGAKRRGPHFDDLVFLGASLSRYPLEGYLEKGSPPT